LQQEGPENVRAFLSVRLPAKNFMGVQREAAALRFTCYLPPLPIRTAPPAPPRQVPARDAIRDRPRRDGQKVTHRALRRQTG
jgi:hypothetical protein